MGNDWLDIVDKDRCIIGRAPRGQCHSDPSLRHMVVHLLIFNTGGELLLQKRSKQKDMHPGKWSVSVGGHLDSGESFEQALIREAEEELGLDISLDDIVFLYDYCLETEEESEEMRSYMMTYDGPIRPNPREIEEARYWTLDEIKKSTGTAIFTPSLEEELRQYRMHYKDKI